MHAATRGSGCLCPGSSFRWSQCQVLGNFPVRANTEHRGIMFHLSRVWDQFGYQLVSESVTIPCAPLSQYHRVWSPNGSIWGRNKTLGSCGEALLDHYVCIYGVRTTIQERWPCSTAFSPHWLSKTLAGSCVTQKVSTSICASKICWSRAGDGT